MLMPFDLAPDAVHAYGYFQRFGFLPGVSLGFSKRILIQKARGMSLYRYDSDPRNRNSKPDSALSEPLPILIIPSLINRSYILDLAPGRSFIEKLMLQGRTVYILEWETPKSDSKFIEVRDHLIEMPSELVATVLKDSGKKRLHLMGHCLGGVVSLHLAQDFSLKNKDLIQTLTLLTTPVNFKDMGTLGLWAKSTKFDFVKFQKAYGNMKWPVMQLAFQLAKPMAVYHKFKKLYQLRHKEQFVRNFFALELWSSDNMDFPEKVFQYFVKDLYQNNALLENHSKLMPFSFSNIQVPILNYYSKEDHIVPAESVLRKDMIGSDLNYQEIQGEGGHLGVVIGPSAVKNYWNDLFKFLDLNEGKKTHVTH